MTHPDIMLYITGYDSTIMGSELPMPQIKGLIRIEFAKERESIIAKLIIVSFALATILGCGKSSHDYVLRYYRVVDFSQLNKIIPKYPTKKEYAEEGACWELKYDKQGRLIEASSVKNSLLYKQSDLGFAHVSIKYEPGKETRAFFNEYAKPIQHSPGVSKIVYSYDTAGKCISEEYLDSSEKPVGDSLGVVKYVYLYEPNNDSTIVMLRLNTLGDTINDSRGVFKDIIKLNERGYIKEIVYLDQRDSCINSTKGVAIIKCIYDDNDNLIEGDFFDNEGNRAIYEDIGAAVVKGFYDKYGYLQTLYYYDKNMQLTDNTSTKYAISKKTYAENGLLLKHENIKSDSSSSEVFKYDDHGTLLEMGYHDANGNYIMNNEQGYAIFQILTDSITGLVTDNRFLDQNRQPIEPEFYGYAIHKAVYNEKQQLVEKVFLGSDFQPRLNKQWGFAKAVIEYNYKGKLVCVRKYDIEGNLIETDSLGKSID